MLDADAERVGERRRQRRGCHAEPRVIDLPPAGQCPVRLAHALDGHGVGDASVRLRVDRRDHADDLASGVEQRAARVAVVDGRIGLNHARCGETHAGGRDLAVELGDDSRRERGAVLERAADHGDRVADPQRAGAPEPQRAQPELPRLHL